MHGICFWEKVSSCVVQTDTQITIYCAFNTKSVNWDIITVFSVNFLPSSNKPNQGLCGPLKGIEQYGDPDLKSSTTAQQYEGRGGDEKAWQMSVGAGSGERERERSWITPEKQPLKSEYHFHWKIYVDMKCDSWEQQNKLRDCHK